MKVLEKLKSKFGGADAEAPGADTATGEAPGAGGASAGGAPTGPAYSSNDVSNWY